VEIGNRESSQQSPTKPAKVERAHLFGYNARRHPISATVLAGIEYGQSVYIHLTVNEPQ
jgi:hypothetical protein